MHRRRRRRSSVYIVPNLGLDIGDAAVQQYIYIYIYIVFLVPNLPFTWVRINRYPFSIPVHPGIICVTSRSRTNKNPNSWIPVRKFSKLCERDSISVNRVLAIPWILEFFHVCVYVLACSPQQCFFMNNPVHMHGN